jgi:hypothetical protein
MGQANTPPERLIGRETEMRRLQIALRKRQSQLIWGAADAGKTLLIKRALLELPEAERRKCIYRTGAASRRQLVEQLVRGLYLAGDPLVRKQVQTEQATEATLTRWMRERSMGRLRVILMMAAEQGEYRFFMDHLTPTSRALAELMRQIVYRTKTPIYLTGHGYSQGEIGYAWTLFWTDKDRIRLGPLPPTPARELLEICIQRFGLGSLDLNGFREDILHLSGHLPGSIVKMCELAAAPRYHYGNQVKVKLVHVDYLLQGNRFLSLSAQSYPA